MLSYKSSIILEERWFNWRSWYVLYNTYQLKISNKVLFMKLPLELLVSLEVKQFNSKHTVQQLLLKESARNKVRSKCAAASNADTIRKLACSK